jgi:radical SAM-linked protein
VGADPGNVDSPQIAEPRQRWRLAFRRSAEAPALTHREIVDPWLERLACRLPLPRPEGRPRPALSFAAPLPLGMPVERDLADLVLADRLPIHFVRERVATSLPEGIEVVDLHDVWLGAPPLAASLAAADYRLIVTPNADSRGSSGATADRRDALQATLERAADDLLRARTLPRERTRGSSRVSYDLRPLVSAIRVDRGAPDGPLIIRVRTRFHPERGAGRPQEVLAALGERISRRLDAAEIVRERVILADDILARDLAPDEQERV